jgi:hypothetical protein
VAYTYQQRVLAIPLWIRLPVILLTIPPALILAGYWCYTYTGLYRWLVEMQRGLIGMYVPVLSGLLTFGIAGAIGFLPPALLLFVLVKLNLFPVDPDNPPVPGGQPGGGTWLQEHSGRMTAIFISIVLLGMGAFFAFQGSSAGELTALDLASLEAGNDPPSHFVTTQGILLWDRTLSQSKSGTSHMHYVPLVSPAWRESTPIRVYVSIPQTRIEEVKDGKFQGVLSHNGLPGPIRTSFERSPDARPAEPHYLLRHGVVPDTASQAGWFLVILAGVVLLITAIVWVVKAIRERDTRP